MTERKIANRIENQSLQKAGGPLWTRTRDPSLIRTEDNTQSTSLSIGKLSDHIIAWYNEQKLKGITEITLYGYRQKVQSFLLYLSPTCVINVERDRIALIRGELA
jgi:hypothetical protein